MRYADDARATGDRFRRRVRRFGVSGLWLLAALVSRAESFVQFTFHVDPQGSPFAREISADVVLPSGAKVHLPAYFAGDDAFAVRACAAQRGVYELTAVVEEASGGVKTLPTQALTPAKVTVSEPNPLKFVRIDSTDTHRFATSDGRPYFPIGTNLPWPDARGISFYPEVLERFHASGLNWTRIWMAHWANLNLDWHSKEDGPSPQPGTLDLAVAKNWDRVLEAAEANGVYVQLVLQHHGQYGTKVDANWDANPWNAANAGGFLAGPTEFFTAEQAKQLTRQKYRYVVARWGFSPAILCWELFNEVHNTDAMRFEHAEPAVAAWHSEMAGYLRSIDVNRHLVTTSVQDLRSPVYSALDYRQPHLYPAAMLSEVRRMRDIPPDYRGPSFYGEVGDDNLLIPRGAYQSAVALVPSVWASLGGEGTQPAQNWYGERLIKAGRLAELGALAKVVTLAKLAEQHDLVPFTPAMESSVRNPLILKPGNFWEKRPEATIAVPFDGREPASFGDFPRVLVGKPESVQEGYAPRVSFQTEHVRPTRVRIHIADAAAKGANLRILLDGEVTALEVWPALPKPVDGAPPAQKPAARPTEVALDVPAGRHLLTLDNSGSADFVTLDGIDFGVDVPAVAAVGKRNAGYAFLWVWNRIGVLALDEVQPVASTVKLDDVAAGHWRVVWWDGITGAEIASASHNHPGGTLTLEAPPIRRHAAAMLVRER